MSRGPTLMPGITTFPVNDIQTWAPPTQALTSSLQPRPGHGSAPARQLPAAEQVSAPLQKAPSSQFASERHCTQASSLSRQKRGAEQGAGPGTHTPALQASPPLQKTPSSQSSLNWHG